MCVTSAIGEVYRDRWIPQVWPNTGAIVMPVSREEFDALQREVELMRELLIRAKQYDADNGEPDCEMDEKVEVLRRVAELVGVDLVEVFG